ncbi:saccharopine dehydrogenase [Thiotrichales bacterium 19S11-10]|nr:saccharopine dehydrogenase [Thiotrichales bacterium 19S11-10]MCF6806813.1 saccharopine dehydrogenase [Thiotrichales bacterium 19S9-11]MCF6810782.1 saccharopine dehydrogenase [Thiotrichales bacterium 19S9-12]
MPRKIIWLRTETKPHERRTPLTPGDAKKIINCNYKVFVESSQARIFKDSEYARAGCLMVEPGSWINAPLNAYILGIKELPKSNTPLHHKHIYFAHAYKNQIESNNLLARFRQGKGLIYDLEFLKNVNGNRIVCFSYWAGLAGCAVALLLWIRKQRGQQLIIPECYPDKSTLIQTLREEFKKTKPPSSLVIGAGGRCASGVTYLLNQLGFKITPWYRNNTTTSRDYSEIFQHDLLFNCVYLTEKIPPFITKNEILNNKKLSIIADISCDPNGPFNPLPIYRKTTTFKNPVTQVGVPPNIIDIMAIDHLPSFLPKESSRDFSCQLTPILIQLLNDGPESKVWKKSASVYHNAIKLT